MQNHITRYLSHQLQGKADPNLICKGLQEQEQSLAGSVQLFPTSPSALGTAEVEPQTQSPQLHKHCQVIPREHKGADQEVCHHKGKL